jgi:hypothetical protein
MSGFILFLTLIVLLIAHLYCSINKLQVIDNPIYQTTLILIPVLIVMSLLIPKEKER